MTATPVRSTTPPMSASDASVTRRRRRHPRPPLIVALRILLAGFALSVTLVVIGWAVVGAWRSPQGEAGAPPIELTGPRLIGEDDKQRPFLITADTALREPGASQRIRLHRPILTRDAGGADNMRVTAAEGVYDEAAGRLELSGGVKVSGARGEFSTPATTYDTRTGKVVGPGAVQAAGDIGQMQARSFSVTNNGKSVVYKGGVHARLTPK
ncbi:MAG: hypothetical protein JWQ97_3807 [Phenylobacterium sp.]|nr:hypothetical protein [Phenylobacterium sp.]